MASLRNLLEGPTPRPLLYVGIPIAGVLLTTLFVFLGFPYDLFAPRLARQLSSATGSEIVIESIEPRITIAGPGMAARNVFVLRPNGASLSFDPLFVRPAWSTSWLRGDPSIHIDLRSEQGSVQGTILLAREVSADLRIEGVDLARLPVELPPGVAISGLLEADVDIRASREGQDIVGQLIFEAHDGSISHPLIPIDLDFAVLSGDVALGGETLADIKDLRIDGTVISAQLRGQIQPRTPRGQNPIKLNVDLEVKQPNMQTLLRSMGVRLDPEGRTKFRLVGTLQNPKPR